MFNNVCYAACKVLGNINLPGQENCCSIIQNYTSTKRIHVRTYVRTFSMLSMLHGLQTLDPVEVHGS